MVDQWFFLNVPGDRGHPSPLQVKSGPPTRWRHRVEFKWDRNAEASRRTPTSKEIIKIFVSCLHISVRAPLAMQMFPHCHFSAGHHDLFGPTARVLLDFALWLMEEENKSWVLTHQHIFTYLLRGVFFTYIPVFRDFVIFHFYFWFPQHWFKLFSLLIPCTLRHGGFRVLWYRPAHWDINFNLQLKLNRLCHKYMDASVDHQVARQPHDWYWN